MALRVNVTKRVAAIASAAMLAIALVPGLAFAGEAVEGPAQAEPVSSEAAVVADSAASADSSEPFAVSNSESLAPSGSNELPPIVAAADSTVDSVIDTVNDMIDAYDETDDEDDEDYSVVTGIADEIAYALEYPEDYLYDDEEFDDGEAYVEGEDDYEEDADANAGPSAIVTQAESADHTIVWDAQANGTAELVSVRTDSAVLTRADLEAKTVTDPAYFINGILCAPAGSEVTARFLPARGYQLMSNMICDGAIALNPNGASGSIGEYTFAMPDVGVVLDCGFVATEDVLESNSVAVVGGSIADTANAVDNGTLYLEVNDTADESAREAIAAKAANANDVVAYLDLNLENIIYQATEGVAWEEEITSLASPVALTLVLSDEIAASSNQFYIIREYGGQYQQAAVSFDASTRSITFRTDKFSNYAIVKGAMASTGTGSNTGTGTTAGTTTGTATGTNSTTTPKTGDTTSPAPFAASALLSVVVAAFALRRVTKIGPIF